LREAAADKGIHDLTEVLAALTTGH
jgi:hypothetical protein